MVGACRLKFALSSFKNFFSIHNVSHILRVWFSLSLFLLPFVYENEFSASYCLRESKCYLFGFLHINNIGDFCFIQVDLLFNGMNPSFKCYVLF